MCGYTLPVVNVDLRLLRSFVAVAEELNFTRAAKRLFIAQQALSAQIQQLEAAVGTQLLTRTTRHVELSAAGESLLADARRILRDVEASVVRARRIGLGRSGTLRIAYTITASYEILPALVAALEEEFPDLEVQVHEAFGGTTTELVTTGTCDIALAQEPEPVDVVSIEEIRRDILVLQVSEHHRLAERAAVSMTDLAGERLGVFSRDAGPGFHDTVVRYWASAGLPLDIDTSATGSALYRAVAEGRRITINVASIRGQEYPGTVVVPFTEDCTIGLFVIWSPRPSPAAEQALGVLRRLRRRHGWVPASTPPEPAAPPPLNIHKSRL